MLLVVGGCWAGVPPQANATADLLATISDAADDMQLFWEVGGHAAVAGRCWLWLAWPAWHGMAWHGMLLLPWAGAHEPGQYPPHEGLASVPAKS